MAQSILLQKTSGVPLVEWPFVLPWMPIIFLADELRKALLRLREHNNATFYSKECRFWGIADYEWDH